MLVLVRCSMRTKKNRKALRIKRRNKNRLLKRESENKTNGLDSLQTSENNTRNGRKS